MTPCVICGEPEHRDADRMLERCEYNNITIERIEPVYLRDLGVCLNSPVAAA